MQVFGEPGSGLGRSSAAIIIAARSLASRSVCDDQADSTAQFLDWFKTPMPSWGIFEYYRRRAEELEARRKPPPVKTVYARGSMEWQAEQEKLNKAG